MLNPTIHLNTPAPWAVLKKSHILQQDFGHGRLPVVDDMATNGNAVYAPGFDLLLEAKSDVVALIREEMDILNFHSRRLGRNAEGSQYWNHVSQLLLSAQLIRQDLWLWATTAALREDYTYELQEIPIPARYDVAEDKTESRLNDCSFTHMRDSDKILRDKLANIVYKLHSV